MSAEIKRLFDENMRISVSPPLAKAVINLVNAYETKGTHPQAFNSPYLGLSPCYFLASDRDAYFNLFNSDEKDIKKLLTQVISSSGNKICNFNYNDILSNLRSSYEKLFKKQALQGLNGVQARDVRSMIGELTGLKDNFNVATDPLNLFVTYISHLFLDSNIPNQLKLEATRKSMMYMQYKFFTSLVNHRFKYKPDEDIMRATYENMTMKFDIKQYGTWKNVMERRINEFTEPNNQHYKAIKNYDDDKAIIYFITDVQTRIRNQINIFTQEFMKTREEGISIGSYSTVGQDIEGEKMIIDSDTSFDAMCSNVYNDLLSVPRFLDDQKIKLITNLFSAIMIPKFRSFLIGVSELATKQYKAGKQKEIKEEGGLKISIGMQAMIDDIIQKSYRYALNSGVSMDNSIKILTAIKDVYASSRVNDIGINSVRESVNRLVINLNVSQREATIASFRIGFILYIILLSFKYKSN